MMVKKKSRRRFAPHYGNLTMGLQITSLMRSVTSSAQDNPSTMVRLAQELGFPGYRPLRDRYRQKLLLDEAARTRRAKQTRSQKGTLNAEAVVAELLE
jgi:DNA-binding MurR/RpiR family transcriptional regulator